MDLLSDPQVSSTGNEWLQGAGCNNTLAEVLSLLLYGIIRVVEYQQKHSLSRFGLVRPPRLLQPSESPAPLQVLLETVNLSRSGDGENVSLGEYESERQLCGRNAFTFGDIRNLINDGDVFLKVLLLEPWQCSSQIAFLGKVIARANCAAEEAVAEWAIADHANSELSCGLAHFGLR